MHEIKHSRRQDFLENKRRNQGGCPGGGVIVAVEEAVVVGGDLSLLVVFSFETKQSHIFELWFQRLITSVSGWEWGQGQFSGVQT